MHVFHDFGGCCCPAITGKGLAHFQQNLQGIHGSVPKLGACTCWLISGSDCSIPVCILRLIGIEVPFSDAPDVLIMMIVLPAANGARLLSLALLTLQSHHTLHNSLWQHMTFPQESSGINLISSGRWGSKEFILKKRAQTPLLLAHVGELPQDAL